MLTKEEIHKLENELEKVGMQLHLKDEVLAGLYFSITKSVILGLNTLWFYEDSLKNRGR